ncbi:MAG: hypothetical protein ACLFSY_09490 [Desulfonatronovibrionaceae bacterium]
MDPELYLNQLVWPIIRLCFFVGLGVMIGNLIEAMNWTRFMARLATPLVRAGRLKDISGASFSMAFFSGVSANTMLAEAYSQNRLSKKELVLSNLFNALPTYFLHLPTTFFIIVPFIQAAAAPYLALTLSSAFLRMIVVVILSRLLLPAKEKTCVHCEIPDRSPGSTRDLVLAIWQRFKKRMRRILAFTIPIYIAVFFLQQFGVFDLIRDWMASNLAVLSWLPPQAVSIVALQIAAEFSAGLAAAGAMLDSGALMVREVVLALIIGNIFSSPMRALRHQFPYYAGIFSPGLAVGLIFYNQGLRAASLMAVGFVYYFLFW